MLRGDAHLAVGWKCFAYRIRQPAGTAVIGTAGANGVAGAHYVLREHGYMQKAGCGLAAKGEFMAKLYYYYGAMGSSKTANALMTHFNYEEVGQKALLCKPAIDARDGERTVYSRIGLRHECILLEELQQMKEEEIRGYDCIIVDEVQFATPEQVDFLSDIVDFMGVPVVCYGLRTDFRNLLFPGSERLIAIADVIQELKTVCWCGRKATCNTRYNEHGIVRSGPQVMLGANDSYVALCRRHFKLGMLGPDAEAKEQCAE